jgi:hypothetical protein
MGRQGRTAAGHFAKAEADETVFAFDAAYQGFVRAHHEYLDAAEPAKAHLCLFRAGLCLMKAERWRAEPSLWEQLGDLLGETLGERYVHRTSPGQSGMYNVISTDQWDDPYRGYYGDGGATPAAQRHRQAWAYLFAAQSSEAGGQYEQAVREYRKSAVAWELSSWGDVAGTTVPTGVADSRTERHVEVDPTAKWRLAARCYFRAALCTALAVEPRVRERLFDRYTLEEIRWIGPSPEAEAAMLSRAASDLERHERCWITVRKHIGRGDGRERTAYEAAILGESEQLELLQDSLVRSGRRSAARAIYTRRQRLLMRADRSRVRRALRWLFYQATGAGSSVRRTLVSTAIVYAVLLPAVYWLLQLVSAGQPGPANFGEVEIFSMASVVGLNVGTLVAANAAGDAIQTAEGLSGYFVFGYLIWLVLRWYGD